MKKIIFIWATLLIHTICFGQHFDESDYLLNQSVAFWQDSTQIKTHILIEHKEISVQDDLYYFWYKSGEIHHSRGGFSGNLLEGQYTEYFADHALKKQGVFSLGLKDGKWKEWNHKGELISIIFWKKGIKEGDFREFDENGKLIRSGKYHHNLLDGKIIYYSNEAISHIDVYKDGIKKEKKTKKPKTKKGKEEKVEKPKKEKEKESKNKEEKTKKEKEKKPKKEKEE